MFQIQNLSFGYQKDKQIINIESWEATQGEPWLLLGNSGSGKTTLLHILAGLRKAKTGNIWIGKENIQELNGGKLDKFRGQNIGIIFQKPHLIDTLSVLKNLFLAQNMAGIKQDKSHCIDILQRLDIAEKKNEFPQKLSSGQAQRVSVARAIVNNPMLILADEPTASLDDKNAIQVIQLLKEQAQKQKATLVIATHDHRVKQHFDKQFQL